MDNFEKRYNAIMEILKINDPEMAQKLREKSVYWAPESKEELVENWINFNIPMDTQNPSAIAIYSLLTLRKTEELMNQENLGSRRF